MKKVLILVFAFLIGALAGKFVEASELDSFTLRSKVLTKKNAVPLLNQLVKEKLQKSVDICNSKVSGCESKDMLNVVRDQIVGGFAVPFPQCRITSSYPWVNGFKGTFEQLIQKGNGNSKDYVVPMKKKDSVFKNVTTRESTAITVVLGSLLNANGYVVGSDKFGHFFSQGLEYFELGGSKNLLKVLEYGHCLETKVLGLSTSGVYSYGDLSANIMGMLFWERLIGEDKFSNDSYLIYREGKWSLNLKKEFNWDHYISPSWDEGINNSFFYSKSITEKVKSEIIKLQLENQVNLTPPLTQNYCEIMVDKFIKEENFGSHNGHYVAKHAISPICLNLYAKIQDQKEMGILSPEISLPLWENPQDELDGEIIINRWRPGIMYYGIGSFLNFNDEVLAPLWSGLLI